MKLGRDQFSLFWLPSATGLQYPVYVNVLNKPEKLFLDCYSHKLELFCYLHCTNA